MGEKVAPGFSTGTPEAADTEIRFEKGDPFEGSWYICDRSFTKVKINNLRSQAGGHVRAESWDKDEMDENR